jgi:hypothetical protein
MPYGNASQTNSRFDPVNMDTKGDGTSTLVISCGVFLKKNCFFRGSLNICRATLWQHALTLCENDIGTNMKYFF